MYSPSRATPRSTRTDRLLGAAPVAGLAAALTSRRLRGLAYHRVPDPGAFRRQLEVLDRGWSVVDLTTVVDWFAGRRQLPARAVWITFDDGDPSVIEAGMPELDRLGMTATLFVCPGLVDGSSPPWWRVVEHALADAGRLEVGGRTWSDRSVVTHLKTVPDQQRRAIVAELEARHGRPGDPVPTVDDLRRWTAGGHALGNHTWDHPCLDRCEPDEQRRQVVTARDWLRAQGLVRHEVFAYPNGNRSDTTEAVLEAEGVELCALFDHHLASTGAGRLRCSRLRVDSDAPLDRFRAILSGAHSGFFGARQAVRDVASRTRRS